MKCCISDHWWNHPDNTFCCVFSPRAFLWKASSLPKCGDSSKVEHDVTEQPTSLKLRDFKGFSFDSPPKQGISMTLEMLFDFINICWLWRYRPKPNPRAQVTSVFTSLLSKNTYYQASPGITGTWQHWKLAKIVTAPPRHIWISWFLPAPDSLFGNTISLNKSLSGV